MKRLLLLAVVIFVTAFSLYLGDCFAMPPGGGAAPGGGAVMPQGGGGGVQIIERKRNMPEWTKISSYCPDNKKEAKKATVFENFPSTKKSRRKQPFFIYVYSSSVTNPEEAMKSYEFERDLLDTNEFDDAVVDFGKYMCDGATLDKKVAKKYGIKVPFLIFFDGTGKGVLSLPRIGSKSKAILKKLVKIKKASDKAVEKALKKTAKKAAKAEQKRQKAEAAKKAKDAEK